MVKQEPMDYDDDENEEDEEDSTEKSNSSGVKLLYLSNISHCNFSKTLQVIH